MGQQVGDRRREPADVDRVGLEGLAPGEGEQALDQLGALLGGAAGHADDLPVLLLQRQPPLDQPEPAEYGCEQVVEVMGDTPGQLPDRVHLAGLEELVLELLAVADVEQGAGILGGIAVARSEQDGLVEEMLVMAVGALPAIFDRHRAGALAVADRAERSLAVLGMEAIRPQGRLRLDRVEREAGHRGEIASDELRHREEPRRRSRDRGRSEARR